MGDKVLTQVVTDRMSLLREMGLGAFWCVAGIFFIGPLASVVYQLLKSAALTQSMTEMLAAGFAVVVWLVLWIPGWVILALVGSVVGAASYRILRDAENYTRWLTVAGAIIADTIIAFGVAGLLFFIRS